MKALKAGQQVDQFRIVRRLGLGGMSEVYLARDVSLGRKVALKIIRAEFTNSPQRLEFFLREARLTAKFAHPHIITIHSVGEFDGNPYLALEYLEGQNLSQRIREKAMSVHETMRIGLAIAQALEEAHSHGVLHRDLKPANVFIPHDGRIRVLDFGISTIAEDSLHPVARVPSSVSTIEGPSPFDEFEQGRMNSRVSERRLGGKATVTSQDMQGTPNYMAPELWVSKKVTGASDIWALGVILYKLLTQVHPYDSEDQKVESIAKKIVLTQKPPPFPEDLHVPYDLSQLIYSMLAHDTSQRPTAKTVVLVLTGILQHKRTQSFKKTSPFRGLLPFSERHSDLYFGRSDEIEMAVERLRHEPILPVVGPSGAGKSSFVAAGIVPRLREMDRWLVLTFRPGTEPFQALASIIQAGRRGEVGNSTFLSSTDIPKLKARDSTPDLTETVVESRLTFQHKSKKRTKPSSERESLQYASLRQFSQELIAKPAQLLLELQALADETQSKVLLFVDQLEELYTLDHDPHLRRAFMEAISQAADDPNGPIRVVFTLREDFLGRVADTPSAQKALSRITVLRALREGSLEEILTKPVEIAGYSYEDTALLKEMINAVRETPASLPILQFACNQLWNRRDIRKRLLTRKAYEAMGGVEGALATEADELLAGLSANQRKVVKQLVLRLVTPEGTRRVINTPELLDGLDSEAQTMLNRLTAARMVVSRRSVGRDGAETELELVHDSLIYNWTPLVRWLEQSREEVVFLDEVSRAAELWVSRGRPKEEVWTGGALEEALSKIDRCEAVPQRVSEFLEAAVLRRQARIRSRRKFVFAIIGSLLAVIAVLAFGIRVTIIQRTRAVNLLAEAQEQRARERLARASALRESARAAYTRGDTLEARSMLRASLEARDSSQARALWWLLDKEPLVWSKSLGGFANIARVSPDGRLVAAGSRRGLIHIYDTKTLERRLLQGHKGHVLGIDFSRDGRWLSSGSDDHQVRLWELKHGNSKVLKGHTSEVWATVFSADGKLLASGGSDKTIRIWDTEKGSLLQVLKCETGIHRLRFTANDRFIISANWDQKLRLWNTKSYELDYVFEEPSTRIIDAETSPDGKLLAYGRSDGVLVIQNLKERSIIRRIPSNSKSITFVNFSPNGDFLGAATSDGKIRIFDTNNWSLHGEYTHTNKRTNSVDFFPNGELFISAGNDGNVKLWKNHLPSFDEKITGHTSAIYGLAFSPDGKTLVTGGYDGNLLFWDRESGQVIHQTHGHDMPIYSIEFQPGGKLLASSAEDGSIRLWKLPERTLLTTLLGHRAIVSRAVFSPDGKQLVSSSDDRTVAFWDLDSFTKKESISTQSIVRNIDFDSTGRLLALGHLEKVDIREFKTKRPLQTFVGHKTNIFSIAFSDNNESIYSSSHDGTVRRHKLGRSSTDGQVVAQHKGCIYWIDVTYLDEDILGTPSEDGTAKIWKVEKSEFITLTGHQDEVNRLRFSPDGTCAATVSDDNTLRLWDTKTGRPLWYSPLMVEETPLLSTRRGWTSFEDDVEPEPSTRQWQKAVENRGKFASLSSDTLCCVTFSDELELWSTVKDERQYISKQAGVDQILAIRNGCLLRTRGKLSLITPAGDQRIIGSEVETMSRLRDSVFVLQNGKVRLFDLQGNQQDEFRATSGASTLTIVEQRVALGFPDGSIEVWQRNESGSVRELTCRDAETSPVNIIIPGPPSTIIAGFANGAVGIWSLETGERLYSQHLHGPVIHLLHRNQTLWAATELGSRLRLDLSMFYAEYCELMEHVWSSVPWIWEEGRPRFRNRPTDHVCSKGR